MLSAVRDHNDEKVYEFMKELDSTVTVARRSNPVLL